MKDRHSSSLFAPDLFEQLDAQRSNRAYLNKEAIYEQGDKADAVFYIVSGHIKLTIISTSGKKAVVAILRPGDFFGEGCLRKQSLRMSTATSMESTIVIRVTRANAFRSIRRDSTFAQAFIVNLLLRIEHSNEELADQVFSSSERRLARTLWSMSGLAGEYETELTNLKVSQETLAEMVGTTRSRVSYFMNRFRERGFIDYNGSIQVHPSLLTFLSEEKASEK